MKLSSDSAIAIPTPHSTPSTATPANAAKHERELRPPPAVQPARGRARRTGRARRRSRRRPGRSSGMSWTRPMPTISSSAEVTAPVSPAIWLRAPTSSATAVRELLEETREALEEAGRRGWRRRAPPAPGSGRRPGAAAPRSCATGRSCRRRRRRRSRPRRGSSALSVVERDVGQAERGQPGGDGADDRELVGEAEHGDQRGRADDGDQARPGSLRRDLPQAEDQRERADAEGERRRVGLVEPRDELAHRAR